MKWLANENILLTSVKYLLKLEFDIKYIGVDHAGISDEEVVAIAIRENRIIITLDSDYGKLIFQEGYRPQAGVVYIRIQPISPVSTGKIVEHLLNTTNLNFERAISVVNKDRIRQKRY